MKHVYYVKHITPEVAHKIWDILVETCGVQDDRDPWGQRESFVRCAIETDKFGRWTEWRFGGNLGFGGKVYNQGSFYVSCYREDETPERRKMVSQANEKLAALHLEYARSLLGDAD